MMSDGARARVDSPVVAVVGLGYVGLPLVIEFGKRIRTIGFDISGDKVDKCRRGRDPSRELSASEMRLATHAEYTSDPSRCCATPTSSSSPCRRRSTTRTSPTSAPARRQRSHRAAPEAGRTVVYESTVYPGATEEVCIPGARADVGAEVEAGLLRRLQPGAHQPGRPRAHADQRRQGGRRRHARDARQGRRALRDDRRARRAPLQQHQGRRGLQGDREHPARPQHRADERAGDHLRAGRASTPARSSRRPARSGTS